MLQEWAWVYEETGFIAFFLASNGTSEEISSGVVFIMNTISPQGIGAVCIIAEGKAPIPYGESYS